MNWSAPDFSRQQARLIQGPATTRASGRMIVELACWLLGTALIVAYFSATASLEIHRERGLELFAQARASQLQDQRMEDRVTAIESKPLRDHQTATPSPVPAVAGSAKSLPVAVLRMASVGLEVPVYPDVSELNLSRGAGWIDGTAAPNTGGNMAIAAHRDRHFGALEDIQIGDILELESLAGQSEFQVSRIVIVEPEDTSVLDDTTVATVTLVTCYPFHFIGSAPQRYIVQATAVETSVADDFLTSLPSGEKP